MSFGAISGINLSDQHSISYPIFSLLKPLSIKKTRTQKAINPN